MHLRDAYDEDEQGSGKRFMMTGLVNLMRLVNLVSIPGEGERPRGSRHRVFAYCFEIQVYNIFRQRDILACLT